MFFAVADVLAVSQIIGAKELVIMADSDHHGTGNAQAPFQKRLTAWTDALVAGRPAPVATP